MRCWRPHHGPRTPCSPAHTAVPHASAVPSFTAAPPPGPPQVFPRPLLDQALDARRLEREQTTREMRAALNKGGSKGGGWLPGQADSGPRPRRQDSLSGEQLARLPVAS